VRPRDVVIALFFVGYTGGLGHPGQSGSAWQGDDYFDYDYDYDYEDEDESDGSRFGDSNDDDDDEYGAFEEEGSG
jgi:hypothetical protein